MEDSIPSLLTPFVTARIAEKALSHHCNVLNENGGRPSYKVFLSVSLFLHSGFFDNIVSFVGDTGHLYPSLATALRLDAGTRMHDTLI